MLSRRWAVEQTASLMACDRPMLLRPMPAGYRLDLHSGQDVIRCSIWAPDGTIAASGFAVEQGGVFVFDRIITEGAHGRRGLGTALMTALADARKQAASA